MQIRLLFSFLFSSILLQSCSSGADKTNKVTVVKDSIPVKESFSTGQVVESVVCQNDASQSYALYLPSTYSNTKTYPVIYAFDPHGTGKIPVALYKDLAEKYGYILIGSNNSKNGTSWEESQAIANKLFVDSQNRLSISKDRINLLGFSGGARIANGLTITNGAIASVICCGAANPAVSARDPRSNYTFLGIAGNTDFNYIEMRKYDMVGLAGRPVKHAFIEFDGKHEWPPVKVMEDAFLWTTLNGMRKNNSLRDDSLISQQIKSFSEEIKLTQKNNNVLETYNLVRKTINFFDGLADLTEYYKIYESLKSNIEIDKKLKQEENFWSREEALKGYYQNAFQAQSLVWWKNEIASVNKKIKTEKDKNEVLMYKRTLDYLSLVSYMQASNALKQNYIPAAQLFCEIYVLVDPTNSEADYLTAIVNATQGNTKEAISSLNKAVDNGFIDLLRLQSDGVFAGINSTEEFKEICKKIETKKAEK
jgi:hypothetical protein